jgi:YHS domain-containing protein
LISKEIVVMPIAIDPICKMEVDTDNPPGGQSEYQGTAYYFCAPGCKVAFERDPEKYLSGEGGAGMPQQQPGQQRVSFISRLFGKK